MSSSDHLFDQGIIPKGNYWYPVSLVVSFCISPLLIEFCPTRAGLYLLAASFLLIVIYGLWPKRCTNCGGRLRTFNRSVSSSYVLETVLKIPGLPKSVQWTDRATVAVRKGWYITGMHCKQCNKECVLGLEHNHVM
jgi:hypothetical protein